MRGNALITPDYQTFPFDAHSGVLRVYAREPREVKLAYARRALKLHPDRRRQKISADELLKVEEEWAEVVRAKDTLQHKESREEYERFLPFRRAIVLFYERYNAGHVGEERIEVAVR